jgi:YNFM family putative membrane transporter
MASFRLTDPLLPAIAHDLDSTVVAVSTAVTSYMLGYGLFQLVYGPLGEKVGKVRVMAFALALCSVATAACATIQTIPMLAFLRLLGGITAGAVVPLALAHIGDTVPYNARQTTIGHYLAATVTGQIVGGSLAGMFAEFFGWRLAFVAVGAIGIVVSILLGRLALTLPRPTPVPAGGRTTHLSLMKRTEARIVWGGVFIEGILVMGAVPFAGAYLKEHFNLDYLTIGLVYASFGVGGLLYSGTVKKLVPLLGERGLVITGGLLVALSYVTMAIAPVWQLFIAALGCIGFGFFCMHSTLQTRATELAPEARATALSGFAFCLFLGQGSGVWLMGRFVDGPGYTWGFVSAAAGVAILAVWLRWALTAAPRSQTRHS